jgi:hypothetical protein
VQDEEDLEEVKQILAEENVATIDEDLQLTFLDALTGCPLPQDILLHAVPVSECDFHEGEHERVAHLGGTRGFALHGCVLAEMFRYGSAIADAAGVRAILGHAALQVQGEACARHRQEGQRCICAPAPSLLSLSLSLALSLSLSLSLSTLRRSLSSVYQSGGPFHSWQLTRAAIRSAIEIFSHASDVSQMEKDLMRVIKEEEVSHCEAFYVLFDLLCPWRSLTISLFSN